MTAPAISFGFSYLRIVTLGAIVLRSAGDVASVRVGE
jgi:hypothetical protein